MSKVTVVTGGAKGIGRAIAKKFSENDYHVVIVDIDQKAGEELADDLSSQTKSIFIKADVSSYTDLENVRNKTIEEFGKINTLVINAGISFRHTIDQISVEEWNKVININLNSSFYTIKAFFGDLKEAAEEAKVVFISSGSGITGTGGGAHYAASKSGQHGLMRTVSKELGAYKVNVNAVAPRVIQSDILDHLYPTEESREELVKKIPIGKFGTPEDIANLTYFLSSDDSSYIHGQIILADGGRTL
ncbi:MAG: SDR family NAD(P)-dependent oxidoreductase [Ruoffia tabacinasalis]